MSTKISRFSDFMLIDDDRQTQPISLTLAHVHGVITLLGEQLFISFCVNIGVGWKWSYNMDIPSARYRTCIMESFHWCKILEMHASPSKDIFVVLIFTPSPCHDHTLSIVHMQLHV